MTATTVPFGKKIQGAIWGAFLGDAASLGYHWIYEATQIPRPQPGDKLKLEAPRAKWHNKDIQGGSFTHYGDQTLLLLKSVETTKKYDLGAFWSSWKKFWEAENPASALTYRDGATKNTLANVQSGKDDPHTAGSNSSDFSAVGRFAPLLAVFSGDIQGGRDEGFLSAVREVTALTHNNPQVLASAEFFAKTVALILRSDIKPLDAINQTIATTSDEFVKSSVAKGLASVGEDSTEVIQKQFGPACGSNGALPSAIHIIAKYQDDVVQALQHNIAAGGDNAARGLAIGLILGAYHGVDSLPSDTLKEIKAYDAINSVVSSL